MFFWLQAFCKNGAVGVFSLEFTGLLKNEMSFQRELYVFATCHCVFKGLFEFFRGPLIDFQWRPRLFCHPKSFFNENRRFFGRSFCFSTKVFVFWLQAFCKNGAVGVFSLEFTGLLKNEMSFQRELYVFATCHCVFKGLFEFFRGPLIVF